MKWNEEKFYKLNRQFQALEEKLSYVLNHSNVFNGNLYLVGHHESIETGAYGIITDRKVKEQFRQYKKLKHKIDKMLECAPTLRGDEDAKSDMDRKT